MMSDVIVGIGIYEDFWCQSEWYLPGLGPFRDSLMSAKPLEAKELFSRINFFYLVLSNSFLNQKIIKKEKWQ